MYHQKAMTFSEWIVDELEKRGWSRSEAARRGNISPSMFDKVINGYSRPGVRFLEGIAKAFGISTTEVMRHLEGKESADDWAKEMAQKLSQLDPTRRNIAEGVIDKLLEEEPARGTTRRPRTAGT